MRRWWAGLGLLGVLGCNFDSSGLGAGDSEAEAASGSSTAGTSDTATSSDATSAGSATSASSGATASTTTTGSTTTAASTSSQSSTGGTSDTGSGMGELCDATNPDLVGCWDFEDVEAGTLLDGSMYGNDGTASGATLEPSPLGQAVRGSAASELSVPDGGELDLDTEMTLEAWVYFDTAPASGRMGVIDKEGQYSIIVIAEEGVRCGGGTSIAVGSPPVVGVWTHLACTYSGGVLTAYVDGVQEASMSGADPLDVSDPLPMGLADTSPDFDEPLDGLLDAVRIWRVARSPAQICEASGNPSC